MKEKHIFELAKTLLLYDSSTGEFKWKKNRSFTSKKGTTAGGIHNGYIRIKIFGHECHAHRIAWYFCFNELPNQIDHINGIKSDNRIGNLRPATRSQQRANAKLNINSSSKIRGVYFNKRLNKWRAHIQREHIGYFETKEAAKNAYEIEFDIRFGSEYRRKII